MAPGLDIVVVGMDFSGPSQAAASWVRKHLAPDARIVLVHSLDLPEPPAFLRALVPPDEAAVESARQGAAARLDDVRRSLDGDAVEGTLREGRPGDRIAEVAADLEADLVVVGEHGHRRGIAGVLGSTAEQLVRSGQVPVLLARRLPDGPPTRVLVAVDGSAPSEDALAWAALLQQRMGSRIELLHVVHHHLVGRMSAVSSPTRAAELRDRLVSETGDWLEKRAHAVGLQPPLTGTRVAVGDPVAEILASVEREAAELVVLGSRGSGGVTRSLGSVARAVLRQTDAPVLVVPGSPADTSAPEEP